jgi:hypothetical protein
MSARFLRAGYLVKLGVVSGRLGSYPRFSIEAVTDEK